MGSANREGYAMGYGSLITKLYASRRLADEASFVIPLVHPEHKVIDCGCGPGSMTIDLANLAHRGEAVGVDIETSQIDMAKDAASVAGISNVRFEVASVYDLPFADAHFDLAYASAVLGNTQHPDRVLREMRRVIKPGGSVCVRAFDLEGSLLSTPEEPLIMECERLHLRLRRHYHQDPGLGRRIGELLAAAGFINIEVSDSSHEVPRSQFAGFGKWMQSYVPQGWGAQCVALGWCTEKQVDEMAAAWGRAGECEDATMTQLWYSACATRPDS